MNTKEKLKTPPIDRIMYFMGMAIPVFTSSQVIQIWMNKNAEGVSLIAWATYAVNSILWVIYGKLHKQKPVVFVNAINLLINILVVIGTIIYS